ncbi:MAG: zinc dependent phospholipase C family protein [Anaerolineales bacterium]|nr:zinc dependent phospholipase C family protein [Anaerolineales bacterium]
MEKIEILSSPAAELKAARLRNSGIFMATWIGHLRVAERLLDSLPDLDPGCFAYGSLAPDCGRRAEDGSGFVPPKEISHCVAYEGERLIFQDLVFYRNHLAGHQKSDDTERFSFLLAYFIHLTVDGLWYELIAEASKRDYKELISEKGDEAWWIMKDDWYGLDVHHAIDNQGSLFWKEIYTLDNCRSFLPFQEHQTLEEQLGFIKGFYSNPPLDLIERSSFPYLNEATMDRFVSDATYLVQMVLDIIGKDGIPLDADCSLDLLPTELLLPYSAPLGDDVAA